MSDAVDAEPGRKPALRVVRGVPTEEELAALVALLAARAAAGAGGPEPGPLSGWTDRRAALRGGLHPSRSAWVQTGRGRGVRTRADW